MSSEAVEDCPVLPKRAPPEGPRSTGAVKDSMVAYSGLAKGGQFRHRHQAIFKEFFAIGRPDPGFAVVSSWGGLHTAG